MNGRLFDSNAGNAEHEFRDLLDGASDLIFILSPDARFLYSNRAFQAALGYSEPELRALEVFNLLHPSRYESGKQHFQNLMELGQASTLETEFVTRDGRTIIAEGNCSCANQEGKPGVIRGIFRDITERKGAESALSESESKFRSIIEASPVPYALNDEQQNITYLNAAFVTTYGYDLEDIPTLVHWWPRAYPDAEYREWVATTWQARLDKAKQTGIPFEPIELNIRCKDGTLRTAIVDAVSVGQTFKGVHLVVLYDITERKQAEDDLQRSMKELQVLYQSSHVFSELRDPEIVGQQIIETLERLLNYQRGSIWITGESSSDLYLLAHSEVGLKPDALRRELARVRLLVPRLGEGISGWVALHGEPIRTGDVKRDPRYVEADPAIQSELCVPLKVHGRTIGSINVESFLPHAFTEHDEQLLTTLTNQAAIAIENSSLFHRLELDITERKLVEEKLKASTEQLRALSARLHLAREDEGRRIAREIHDELGGALTGLKWDLEAIDKVLSGAVNGAGVRTVRERLPKMNGLIEATIDTIRRISAELRPSVLDDLGLVAATEWQARQFQTRTGINCECVAGTLAVDLSHEGATAVFRIVQEVLTNVIRHAQATRVDIELTERDGYVEVRVTDNGRGITEDEMRDAGSLGLLGMRERALLVGGEVSINGVPGKGTTVIARVPVR